MRIGSDACSGCFFTTSTNSTPFMRGMFTSQTIPLKPPDIFWTASWPSTASVTMKPTCSRAARTCCRTVAESSTIRIFLLIVKAPCVTCCMAGSSEYQERALARRYALLTGSFELIASVEDDFQESVETLVAGEETLMVQPRVPRRLDTDSDPREDDRRADPEVDVVAQQLIADAPEHLVGKLAHPIVVRRAEVRRRDALRQVEGDAECEAAAQIVCSEAEHRDDVVPVIFALYGAAFVAVGREHALDCVLQQRCEHLSV